MIEQWVIIPVSMLFGFVSMTFGIGVAAMFIPFLVLVYNLPFGAAIAATLLIEMSGFSAAMISFVKRKLVSYQLGLQMIMYTVPAAVVGVVISTKIPIMFLMIIFSCILIIIAILIFHPEHEILYRVDDPSHGIITREFGLAHDTTMVSGTVSGFLAGMTGTGMGEVNNYVFLKKYRMNGLNATATSMFVIAITAFVAAISHIVHIIIDHPEYLAANSLLVVYAISGVLVGIFIAHKLEPSMKSRTRERFVATLFFVLGIVTILSVII